MCFFSLSEGAPGALDVHNGHKLVWQRARRTRVEILLNCPSDPMQGTRRNIAVTEKQRNLRCESNCDTLETDTWEDVGTRQNLTTYGNLQGTKWQSSYVATNSEFHKKNPNGPTLCLTYLRKGNAYEGDLVWYLRNFFRAVQELITQC